MGVCLPGARPVRSRHVEAKENVASLTADSMRLKQILLNLSNAFKFTKEGK